MQFDITFFVLAALATLFAGVSKGGFGSGAAFAAAPILALVVPPAMALGIMLPLLMLVDVAMLKPYWNKWSWEDSKLVIIGALPGVALGVWLYQIADADIFRLLIGAVSLAFVAWQIGKSKGWFAVPSSDLGKPAGLLAGAVAGFTSFVSHAGGPPLAVYLLARRLDKLTYQSTTVLVFWMINIFKAVPYTILGIFTWQTLMIDLILAPFALLGAWIGVKAHHRVDERLFFNITYVLLVCTGSKLIWDALT